MRSSILGLQPAELAIHPLDGRFLQSHPGQDLLGAVLYVMCEVPRVHM
jgi:hypothetical protein